MKKLSHVIYLVIASILILSLVGPLFTLNARAADDPPRAHPGLLQYGRDHPNEKVRVIVQRFKGMDLPQGDLEGMGGKHKKELPMIDSSVMEMPARAVEALAHNPAVRWVSPDAPLLPSSVGNGYLRDEFTTISFAGNNTEVTWSGDWQENGEANGPTMGYVRVVSSGYCASGNCLRLVRNGVSRQVNLQGTATSTLSFNFRRSTTDLFAYNVVYFEVSPNGGASWTTLDSFHVYFSDSGQGARSYDLTPFISLNTQIRFRVAGTSAAYFYVDNVQIDYTYPLSELMADIGADRLWNETSLDGQGVTVAVIDSGININSDLANGGVSRVVASVNYGNSANTDDENGHGTHVAGILAGNGIGSNGTYRGVAPGVNLVNVKVSDALGVSYTSDLVESMQWVYDNRAAYNIRVVNISLNSSVPESYQTSPLDAAVEILWFSGITVVVSAGNNGSPTGPVVLYPPANDPFVITVGSVDDMGTPGLGDDTTSVFSAYGATEDGFSKPDLVAPGRNVVSLSASLNAVLVAAHPKHRVNDLYFRMSGTSMAAPAVSGAVALLLQKEPNLSPDQVKFRLVATARQDWPGYQPAKAGAGYLNVYNASFSTSSESANTGILPSLMLTSGSDPIAWGSVAWNSVAWNSVAWNSVAWNSVAWNSVAWNSVAWNSSALWDD